MNIPPVSVIIPCYNQGHYIKDALDSLEKCESHLFELLIVNDCSTDAFTNQYLMELKDKGYNVIYHEVNKGLGEARNTGIRMAKGKYILPLDADNRIYPDYITKSLEIFEKYENVAVVYGNSNLFGDEEGISKPGPFNLQRLMLSNYIDACAVIKKSVLEEVGLYDNMKIMGWEDWDLWLRIAFAGYGFYYVDEVLFDYRVVNTSMSKKLYRDYKKPNQLESYIHNKYPDKMGHNWIVEHYVNRFKKSPLLFVSKLFLKSYFPAWYNKLLAEHKIRNGL